MMKVTVIYGHPKDPRDFEHYYEHHHAPIAGRMKGLEGVELTRFATAPDGGKPAYYRMAELYFATPEQMEKTMQSPEGKATMADLDRFATGGFTILIGVVQD